MARVFAPSLLAIVLSSSPGSATSSASSAKNAVAQPEVSVPFGCGLTFPVSQAHDTGSHRHNDVWAWDFRMPEGTPITAAKDGTVRMARGDSTEGACSESAAAKSNYVVIAHGQGLETQYLHLSRVLVRPGTQVRAGELIGYSGKTGWSCGPHLHFKVTQGGRGGWNNPSVPALIAGYGDPQANVLVTAPACGRNVPEVLHANRRGEGMGDGTGKTVLANAVKEVVELAPPSAAAAAQPSPAQGGAPSSDPASEVLQAEEPAKPRGG